MGCVLQHAPLVADIGMQVLAIQESVAVPTATKEAGQRTPPSRKSQDCEDETKPSKKDNHVWRTKKNFKATGPEGRGYRTRVVDGLVFPAMSEVPREKHTAPRVKRSLYCI